MLTLGKFSIVQSMHPANLFRDDGTPAYTIFVKRRAYAPPCISIDIPGMPSGRYQKRVSIVLKDVEDTWRRVADLWIEGIGLSKRTTTGRMAYESIGGTRPVSASVRDSNRIEAGFSGSLTP